MYTSNFDEDNWWDDDDDDDDLGGALATGGGHVLMVLLGMLPQEEQFRLLITQIGDMSEPEKQAEVRRFPGQHSLITTLGAEIHREPVVARSDQL